MCDSNIGKLVVTFSFHLQKKGKNIIKKSIKKTKKRKKEEKMKIIEKKEAKKKPEKNSMVGIGYVKSLCFYSFFVNSFST